MVYSDDFRLEVIKFIKAGHTQKEACENFNVSITAVGKWRKILKETGRVTDPPRQPREHRKVDPAVLKKYLVKHPDASLKEIARIFSCSEASASRNLKKIGAPRKRYIKIDPDKLRLYFAQNPNASYEKAGKAFACTDTAVLYVCKRHGIIRKKCGTTHAICNK